jgi:hypothetical protein
MHVYMTTCEILMAHWSPCIPIHTTVMTRRNSHRPGVHKYHILVVTTGVHLGGVLSKYCTCNCAEII